MTEPSAVFSPDDIVIVGAARTPSGKLLGALSSLSAPELGGIAIAGALEKGGVSPELVDMVVLGEVLQAGVGQNPAKQAALAAGIPASAHTSTVNKVCLSGLTAIIDAARALRCGDSEVAVAGGMESMSRAPHLLPDLRVGKSYGGVQMIDHMAYDGLTAADIGIPMGELSERYAERFPVTREEQDAFAAQSHQRAHAAWEDGTLAREVVPVTVRGRKGDVVVERDEGVRPDSTPEAMARLRPAFTPDGTITAGNASSICDGAAAVVLTTRARAEREGWRPMATLRACGQVAGPDHSLQAQPAQAIAQALQRQGWTADDLDLVEINEAFAAVVVHSARELGVDLSRVNECGGGISIGHPIGASGGRLTVHLAHQIASGKATRGAIGLCGGGGQGEALLLES
ncbi:MULTISPECIES: acetyl-CoA C-acyltransferase [unclassified Luteococcus]|uniref:acetyl-CoA C-acyltransferase n=1 Tax=unclassified Luteococcus TaxID=2639923 RepID=UPI00313DB4D4